MDASLNSRFRRPFTALVIVLGFAMSPLAARADLFVGSLAQDLVAGRSATSVASSRPLCLAPGSPVLVYRARNDRDADRQRPEHTHRTIPPLLALLLIMAQPPPTSALNSMGIHSSSTNPNSLYPPTDGPSPNGVPDSPPIQHMPEPASLISGLLGSALAGVFGLLRRRKARRNPDA